MGYGTVDVELTTEIGPISVHFTDENHAAVFAGSDHARPHVNDSNPTIAVAGKEYIGMVHLYAPNWEPKQFDEGSWSTRPGWKNATEAKRRKIDGVISEAVRNYVASNPDTLRRAEIARTRIELQDAYEATKSAEKALEAARNHEGALRLKLDRLKSTESD